MIPKGSLQEGAEQPSRYPAGTGPFRFVEWQPQQRTVFERYEDYWGPKAYIDRLVLRPIPDASVRFLALRAGDVDIIERTPYEWVKQITEGKVKGMGFAKAAYAGFRRIVFNVDREPFNDKRMRLAVAHAIDKREIMETAYLTFGEPTDQKYPKGMSWHIEGVPAYRRDLDRAAALLKETGYRGQSIELMAQRGEEAEPMALQSQLKRIGMNVTITVLDSGTYGARHRKGDFSFYFGGSDFTADPSSTYQTDLLCEPDLNNRSNNSSGYCDQEMDALLKRAESEMDQPRRKALFTQIVTKLVADAPELHIGFVPRFFTFRDHVKGFTTDGNGFFRHREGGLNHTWLDPVSSNRGGSTR